MQVLSLWGGEVESALSGRGENTFGRLRESAGARRECGGSERVRGSDQRSGRGSERAWRLGGRGELGGAETLRAWRARGVQGAYNVHTCAVRSAWARPPRASVASASD